jgi:eukaryotic-like serine/threonine-protein kinase
MDPARWKKIDELIDSALELPEPEREAFVAREAGDDEDLRNQVLHLLSAHKDGDNFLLRSAMNVAAKALASDEPSPPTHRYLNRKIATYRIDRQIGAGGMGEVYLAFDEKLKRKVALKILPAEFTSNDERVKRFETEARVISSLNHPNIVTIYDVGNFEGINYIATEFVEGKTLRDLMGGEFKIRNILINSIQICDALSAAHKEGIIHRDIKPENIMIRDDGYAKILDFGLAKLTEISPDEQHDFAKTSEGVLIGTPAYMSPAQISDDKVDHRTDLWSCGVVFYEFLSGKNPFKGANRHETFKAILSKDPASCSSQNPSIPAELDRILAKLMDKDISRTYQSATELRADLKRVQRDLDSSTSMSSGSWRSTGSGAFSGTSRAGMFAIGGLLVLLSALAAAGYYFINNRRDPSAIDWKDAKSVQLTDQAGVEYFPSIAPDGKTFVYAAEENGSLDIFSQRIGGKNRVNLTPGSAKNDSQPAFSPDGGLIAFRSDTAPRGIYVMESSGENRKLVADFGYHPSWSPDGKELVISSFGRDQPTVRPAVGTGALSIVNVATGSKRELAKIEASFPTWSPNGHRIAYWFYSGTFSRREIATIPASGGEPVVVAKDFAVSNWNPVWSPDGKYLYFVSSKAGSMSFWRVPIDEITGEALDEPEAVATPSKYSRHLTFSRDGKRLVYVQTNDQSNIQGVDFDPVEGKAMGDPFWITQGDREIARAELSPDGTRFVLRLNRRTQEDVVTVSRDGRDWRDVTDDEPFDRYIRWSPDGKQIAFGSDRNGGSQIWICNADGTNLRQLTYKATEELATSFPVWSPTGDRISVYYDGTTTLLDPSRSENEQQAPTLPKDPKYRIVAWDWSPDGKKLAGVIAEGARRHIGYFSFETNQYHVVIEDSDELPSWLPDSRRIVYSVGSAIFLADTELKTSTQIFSNPLVDVRSPFVSRDGKLLYYTAGNTESDIWLLDLTPGQ